MKGLKKHWSTEELEDLKLSFATVSNKNLAARYNCGWRTVIRKARELGLEKAADFRDSIDFSSFGKGLKPWNKGKKIPADKIPEGTKKTWFKKGHPSPSLDPAIHKRAVATRNEVIRRDKLRRRYGLSPITKLNLKNLD